MLKNQLLVSNQILRDGYLNGKEKAIKRRAKKEETKHKVLAQWELNKRMYTTLRTAQAQKKLQNKQIKEEND